MIVIMAHPQRKPFVAELEEQLPGAEVVWDRSDDRWETGRRALLAHDPQADHHLIVQDDAIPCCDFAEGAECAASAAGERPVSFYAGRPRPLARRVSASVARARRAGESWFAMEGPLWGVALAIPTAHIEELVRYCDQLKIANYDSRLGRFYKKLDLQCWYTVPSLVDHRPVDENPSLVAGRTADRRAHYFIGDRSALEIDWSKAPLEGARHGKRDSMEKRIATRRLYGYDRFGRRVLVAAKGKPIPVGFEDVAPATARAASTPAREAEPKPEKPKRAAPARRTKRSPKSE